MSVNNNSVTKAERFRVLLRTIKHFNDDLYIDKIYHINTLNIHLGSVRKSRDIYYYIEINNNNSGFFAHIYWVMNGLYIADRLGLIPYISIRGSKYNDPKDPQDNMYEHYYVQKNKKMDGANYIKYEISLSNYIWKEFDMDGYIVSEDYIDAMADILNKRMALKAEIKSQIEDEITQLIKDPAATLAIHARGTAYSVGFYGHPVQVVFEDYQKYIETALQQGFKYIFLATDDESIKAQYMKEYGERILMFGDVLRSSNSLDVIDLDDQRKDNAFLLGYEVLRDAMAMAYCDGFIAGLSKVSMYTRIQRKAGGSDFRFKKIIDKGIVEKKNYFSEQKYRLKRLAFGKTKKHK